MKRWKTRAIGLLLVLTLLLSLPAMALAAGLLADAVDGTAAYLCRTVPAPQVGSIGGEWVVIGLARSGYKVPQAYWDDYYAAVEAYVKANKGVLHEKKYTEYSRVALALTAIGADPTDVAGYDLLKPLGDFNKTVWQGINGPIWALIALDSGSYAMPVNPEAETQATRQKYIDEILSRQLDNGGWSLNGGDSAGDADPDVTGMALQALANYQDQAAVQTAIDAALACLSGMQDADGGYASWGTTNSESVVQVLVGLCALGIDLNDSRFVKNGNTLLDNLMQYRGQDGSFQHTSVGSGSSQMATEQGFYGLVAARRAAEGKAGLYRMTDVTIRASDGAGTGDVGLPGKHPDVQKASVAKPGASFADVSGHANQTAIEALIARNIINGMGDGSFAPDATMTRAQFAAIVVKALGLSAVQGGTAAADFSDVPAGKWYHDCVAIASSYGLITGRGNGLFDPESSISRQEAAVMVTRAAKLCGMNTEMDAAAVRDMLAQFGDYVTISTWAQPGVAFCYGADILDQSDLNVEPTRAILRCEIAQMLYNMLGSAALL